MLPCILWLHATFLQISSENDLKTKNMPESCLDFVGTPPPVLNVANLNVLNVAIAKPILPDLVKKFARSGHHGSLNIDNTFII